MATTFELRIAGEEATYAAQAARALFDEVDRLENLGSRGVYLKQTMQDKLIEHKHYIDKHGQDMPEIRNWKWPV